MRTAISEVVPAGGDLGFESVPRAVRPALRPRVGDTTTHPVDRRPRAAIVRYDRPRIRGARDRAGAGRVHGPHPMRRVERARLGFATLAVAALVSAAAVGGLIGVVQLRAPGPAPQPTELVQVREGESLTDVATRVAPTDPVAATVRKIVALNGLRGSEVAPGRTLIVPVPAH
jgi:hypothetical protein